MRATKKCGQPRPLDSPYQVWRVGLRGSVDQEHAFTLLSDDDSTICGYRGFAFARKRTRYISVLSSGGENRIEAPRVR